LSYYLERVQRGVDFIEARLDEDIELCRVAKEAGLSQWHFQRIFKALTGETLKTYIRSRRLAQSLDRLLTTELRVLDIALLAGFESQEAFARAFKAAFDLTPQQYRDLGKKALFLKKPAFGRAYLEHLQQNVSLTPELYTQPRTTLVGLRTQFFSVDSEKNNISEQLPSLWAAFVPAMSQIEHRIEGMAYGVVQQERSDSDRLVYHAAVAVTAIGSMPLGLVALEIPETRYAKFSHRGPAQNLDRTVSYAYGGWLAQSDYQHAGGADLEFYGPEYHPTHEDSLIHYAIPVG